MNTIEQSSALADVENAVRNRPNDFAAFEASGSAYFEESLFIIQNEPRFQALIDREAQ
jgi:hypothetical protein